MPQVGNKKFPYTKQGIRQAQKAYERRQNPLASAAAGFRRKQKFGAALNQLRNSRPAGPANNLRRADVEASNQKMTEARPQRMEAQVEPRNRVRQALPTPPSFGRPPMRVPGNLNLPGSGNRRQRPAGGVRPPIRKPKGAVGPGERGIRPFPQNYRPIRKKMR